MREGSLTIPPCDKSPKILTSKSTNYLLRFQDESKIFLKKQKIYVEEYHSKTNKGMQKVTRTR